MCVFKKLHYVQHSYLSHPEIHWFSEFSIRIPKICTGKKLNMVSILSSERSLEKVLYEFRESTQEASGCEGNQRLLQKRNAISISSWRFKFTTKLKKDNFCQKTIYRQN